MEDTQRTDLARGFLAGVEAVGDALDAMMLVAPSSVTGNYEIHGNPSSKFVDAMAKAYGLVPEPMRDYLSSEKARVAFAGITLDLLPAEYSTTREATLDDPRTHRNEYGGYFFIPEKMIAVMETAWKVLPPPPPDDDEHSKLEGTSGEVHQEKFYYTAIETTPEHTLYHETGHGLFHLVLSGEELTQYLEAYREDLKRLGGPQGAREKGYGYFVQDAELRGADETFAETFAMQMAEIGPSYIYERAPPPLPGDDSPRKEGILAWPYKHNTEKWGRDWSAVSAWIKGYSDNFVARTRQRTLTKAIANGDTTRFLNLLRDPDVDVNIVNIEGDSLLALAAKAGHVDMVKSLLLRPEIDINSRNIHTGESALYRAVSNNHGEIVELLLNRPEIDVRNSVQSFTGEKPIDLLNNAIWNADVKIVRRIAMHPAIDVNAVISGMSALERAVCGGKPEIVDAVIAGRPTIESVLNAQLRLGEVQSSTIGRGAQLKYISIDQSLHAYRSELAPVSEGLRPTYPSAPSFLSGLQR